ncbi:Zinc finger protein 423 [Frankliniella fusca]|uniref:Zinc finger protein 423 n=1 Tax=Frankliniella fusca TaxID=407009 RepID=A0AAE1LSN9_9NEOP|nr:Zinc finger protein 423 [Frankliniella fusca]
MTTTLDSVHRDVSNPKTEIKPHSRKVVNTMDRKRYLMCLQCDPATFHTDVQSLNIHMERKHGSVGSVKCGLCKKEFIHRTSLIRHIKSHIKNSDGAEEDEAETTIGSGVGQHSLAGQRDQDISMAEGNEDSDDNTHQNIFEQPTSDNEDYQEPDFQKLAAMFLLKLRSSGNLTNASVFMIQNFVADLLTDVLKGVEHSTSKFITESLGVDKEEASQFLSGSTFKIKNPFEHLETVEEQLQYFSEKFGMAIPEEKMLGSRIENRFNASARMFLPTTVLETFQYISLIDTLTLIVRNAYLRNLILSEEPSSDGGYRNYKDGSDFKRNRFLQKFKYAIRIILYYDDLEIANALGSKDTIHRLGCFYFSIQNLPPEESSLLSSIFLLALTYSEDLKKPGAIAKVLFPFISDLKRLKDGVEIDLHGGQKFILRACLVCLCADALAAHTLLGLLSPSADKFCRLCLVSKNDLRNDSTYVGVLRTAQLHKRHVTEVEQEKALPKKYGVKERSSLAEVMNVPEDSVFDAFHDLVGVVQMVLKLALYEYVCVKKFFKSADFNSSVNMFVYGSPNVKNKPSPNILNSKLCGSDHALKQYGSQTFCLLRVFPFLLKNVPESDDILQLVFLLQDIVKIILSFEITELQIIELENLIYRHNKMFHELFVTFDANDPNVDAVNEDDFDIEEDEVENENLGDENIDDREEDRQNVGRGQTRRKRKKLKKGINKLHHLLHYPQQMREKGPLVRLWCARFEGRHRIFRKHSAVQSNFKNPPKTMARMFQLSTLGSILSRTGTRETVISGGEEHTVLSTEYCAKLVEAGFLPTTHVILAKAVEVCGEEFSAGLFVHLKDESSSSPSFAVIVGIIVKSENHDVYLAVSKCKNNGLSSRYNAYHISNDFDKDTAIVKVTSLAHRHAIAPWTPVGDQDVNLYIYIGKEGCHIDSLSELLSMEDLDGPGLALVLKGHLSDKAISMLNDQCITGSSFMDLDVDTLIAFQFPMGFVVQITKLITGLRNGTKVLDLTKAVALPESETTQESLSDDNDFTLRASIPFENNSSQNNINETLLCADRTGSFCTDKAGGGSEDDDSSDGETNEILSEFITDAGIESLSSYAKKNLKGKIDRWKSLRDLGLPHSSAPNLVIEKKFLKKQSANNHVRSETTDTSKSSGSCRKSARLQTRNENVAHTSCGNSNNEDGCNDDEDIENSEDDCASTDANNIQVDSYTAPPLIKTQEELKGMSPSLPTFEVEKVLLEDSRTKKYVPTLQEGKMLGTKERKAVFRKLGRYLCFNYVDDPRKANSSMREGLAKSIVVTYPQLQKSIDVPGKTPWSHIWSSSGGHLNNIIKRIQTNLPDDKRVRKGKVTKIKKNKNVSLITSTVNIRQLALLMPDRTNKMEIADSMAKTYNQRSLARDNGASITAILKDFPHLCSYNGEMLTAEYKRICPNSKDMCPEMDQYIPKILDRWNDENLVLKLRDETFRAFYILASKLPRSVRGNSCAIPKEEEVVVIITPNQDVKEFILERRNQARKAVQPYILAVRGLLTDDILKYFLVLDGEVLEFGRIPFTRCIDWLFKSYVVFNVEYPKSWALFFRFLQTCMYKVYFSENDDIPPAALEKYNEMRAL